MFHFCPQHLVFLPRSAVAATQLSETSQLVRWPPALCGQFHCGGQLLNAGQPYSQESLLFLKKVLVTPSCLTFCDPMDCSPPGSPVHRISQARILEWIAYPFSMGSSQPGIELGSLALQAGSLPVELPGNEC